MENELKVGDLVFYKKIPIPSGIIHKEKIHIRRTFRLLCRTVSIDFLSGIRDPVCTLRQISENFLGYRKNSLYVHVSPSDLHTVSDFEKLILETQLSNGLLHNEQLKEVESDVFI